MKRALLITLCWLAGSLNCALADTHSVSYSTWTIAGSTVTLRFLLPAAEARTLTGAQVPVLTVRKLEDYLLGHVSVQATTGPCPAIDQGYDLGKVNPLSVGSDLYGFEIIFRCATAGGLVLRNSVLFDQVPRHIDFARIQTPTSTVEQLFTAGSQRLSLPNSTTPPAAGIGAWLWLGILHVLFSPQRWCYLLAIALIAGGRARPSALSALRATTQAVLGLAAGYLLSLATSATGWIEARTTLIEAFTGFGMALLAVTVAMAQLSRPRVIAVGSAAVLALGGLVAWVLGTPPQALVLWGTALLAGSFLTLAARYGAPRVLWVLAAVLGFLEGFELPSLLGVLQLPARSQASITVGFDLGVMLASMGLLAAMGMLGAAMGGAVVAGDSVAGGSMQGTRWNGPQVRQLVSEMAAAALGGLGTFWLLSRLYA